MFRRNVNGIIYNCLRTGIDQYHLFETKPIKVKDNIYKVKYIRKNWKNIDSQRYVQEEPNKDLLVKVVPLKNLNMRDFHNELHLQRKFSLNPSSVLAAYDDENAYIVGEDFDSSLRNFLDSNKELKLEDRIEIVLGLLNEVLLLEQQGILHRDLKPENICVKYNEVTKAWQVRIIDFGLATPVSQTEIWGGTLTYLPPDKKISHASDRFSIGPIIAEMIGCNPHQLLKERLKAAREFDKLSKIEKQLYNFSELPAYNMNSLSVELFPLGSNMRNSHIQLLENLVSPEPQTRYSIEYLLHFFLQVNSALKEINIKESNKSIIEVTADNLGEFSKKVSSKLDNVKDFFLGSKKETKSQKSVLSTSTTSTVVNDECYPLDRDFHALAARACQPSTEPVTKIRSSEYLLLQSLLRHKEKFKKSTSTGIKEVFKKIEEGDSVKETLNVMENVGDTKTAAPSFFTSCISCFFTPRNNNMDAVYHDFARLNKRGENNLKILQEIDRKMSRNTFV